MAHVELTGRGERAAIHGSMVVGGPLPMMRA